MLGLPNRQSKNERLSRCGKGEGKGARLEVDYGKEKVERVTYKQAAGYKTDICEKERDTTRTVAYQSDRKRGKESKINDKPSAIRISW